MVDTVSDFRQIFLTYKDVAENNPQWSEKMIEDYLALKQDLELTAEAGDSTANLDETSSPLTMALINDIRAQIGSGDALTSDETGFTVDSEKLTVDMDEA